MRLSEDKISHISHLLIDGAIEIGMATTTERGALLKQAKQVLTEYCRLDEQIDELVRQKLKSYSRNVGEGSREWDILYRKHFDEEMKKKWR